MSNSPETGPEHDPDRGPEPDPDRLSDPVPNPVSDKEPGHEPVPDPKSIARTFAMPAQLGEQDRISTMPEDCLFCIFSCFDRDTLETMETVSQNMLRIARGNGFMKQRKPIPKLTIFKKRDLFSFHAVLDEEDTLLVYETTGKGDGVRRTSERKNEEPRWDYMYGKNNDQFYKIPEEMFVALERFSLKYAPDTLYLFQVHVDDSFLRRIKAAFHGYLPKGLEVNNIFADKSVKLSEFILDSKITSFDAVWSEPSNFGRRIVDEDFISKYSLVNSENVDLCLNLFGATYANYFIPKRDILPAICRYSIIRLYYITLTIEFLTELIMTAFSTLEHKKTSWTFSLKTDLNTNNLASFSNEMFSLKECYLNDGYRTYSMDTKQAFSIRKNDCRYRCDLVTLSLRPYPNVRLAEVRITFDSMI